MDNEELFETAAIFSGKAMKLSQIAIRVAAGVRGVSREETRDCIDEVRIELDRLQAMLWNR